MYCPKCGKQIPDDSNFCMYCGLNLKEYKVEIKPVIEVSPKIHAEAKAEGIPYPKWKPKPERYVEIKGEGKLPVYKRFAEFNGKFFCPQCGNYDCLEFKGNVCELLSSVINIYPMYECLACGEKSLLPSIDSQERHPKEIFFSNVKKFPRYDRIICCPQCGSFDFYETNNEICVFEDYRLEYPPLLLQFYKIYVCKSCEREFVITPHRNLWVDTFPTQNIAKSSKTKKFEFCDNCGRSIAVMTCPNCGKKYCSSCAVEIVSFWSAYKYNLLKDLGKKVTLTYICNRCGHKIKKDLSLD